MSRTFRFKKQSGYVPWFADYEWKLWEPISEDSTYVEYKAVSYRYGYPKIKFLGKVDPKSKKGKKILGLSHRDNTFHFKEPGPHWFRNLFTDRPLRRRYKEELRKFKLDDTYEVEYITSKLEYWT